jgi:hypothetical protein
MTQQEKFNETVGILVKAYLNDTLVPGDFCCCAVGNLIESHMKFTRRLKITSCTFSEGREFFTWDEYGAEWQHVFMTMYPTQMIRSEQYKGEAKRQIDSTGYTWHQLALIEHTFERTHLDTHSESKRYWEEDALAALLAVVDVLANIHGIDLEQKESAKLLFVK